MDNIDEVWKSIKWFEWYSISNYGNVYSHKSKKIIYKRTSKEWYKAVTLWIHWKWYVFRVWRLVLMTFIRDPINIEQANHINGIKNDDRLSNLEWTTPSENMYHSYRVLGRKWPKSFLGKFWHEHNRSKTIYQIKDWIIINQYGSLLEAFRNTWISFQNISKCCKWKRIHAWWFQWMY